MELTRKDDWHLHLTVQPREPTQAGGFAATCAGVRMKGTVIENYLGEMLLTTRPDRRPTYTELLPTVELHDEELGRAFILLHDCAKFWAMQGWIVSRVKIEGWRKHADALYSEVHVPSPEYIATIPLGWAVSRSVRSGKWWYTARTVDASGSPPSSFIDDRALRQEWCVYDSNRALDEAWLRSWGALT